VALPATEKFWRREESGVRFSACNQKQKIEAPTSPVSLEAVRRLAEARAKTTI
jgi:hypothetical protein